MGYSHGQVAGDVLQAFHGDGAQVESLGAGNINDTYLVRAAGRKFVLQRINAAVFPAPEKIVANFARVSGHITAAASSNDAPFLCAQPLLTTRGELSHRDSEGGVWRGQSWIEHMPAHRLPFTQDVARGLGRTLARFHQLTRDLPVHSLAEPIPGFHCTPRYLEQFDRACSVWAKTVSPELGQALACVERFRPEAALLEDAAAQGTLSRRIIHGDPKIDNVIFTTSGVAAGLFDLDTAGPGLIHYDIGDCLRSCCNRAGEEGKKRLDVRFDPDICHAVLGGYLEQAGPDFGEADRYHIYDAVLVIAFELGLRFLTDYLQGNVYFKVKSPLENLFRALGQFQLAECICKEEKMIRGCVDQ